LLDRGYDVHHLLESDCDLRNTAEVRRFIEGSRPHFVIHLAAVSFVAHGEPLDFYAVNTIGTLNLLEGLSAIGGIRKVVLASSSQVYGATDGEVLTESAPCRPRNHYACSKWAMEQMAETFRDRLPIVVTRPFNYTGRGQSDSFLVAKIASHFRMRAPTIPLGNINVVRDFSDVRLVVDAYCRLLESPPPAGPVNICSGTGVSIRSILDECARLTGHRIEVVVQKELIRQSDIVHLIGSNARLVKTIGPLNYTDFFGALRDMLAGPAAGNSGDDQAPRP